MTSATIRASRARNDATVDKWDEWYDRFPWEMPVHRRTTGPEHRYNTGKAPAVNPVPRGMWDPDVRYPIIKGRRSY